MAGDGTGAGVVPAILGRGWSLPDTIRRNDDPVFDWLHANHPPNTDLFAGLHERRVLAPGEDIASHMTTAAAQALTEAGIGPADVDGITGELSCSPYLTPDGLAAVHRDLGLPPTAWVRPVTDDFTNFLSGLAFADALVASGRARYVLVACGCNWSTMVDYHTAQAVTAGDGAGAAVVGARTDPSQFRLVDTATQMRTDAYGAMYLAPSPVLPDGAPPYHDQVPVFTAPTFTITTDGAVVFRTFGVQAPIDLAHELLARHGLTGADITLLGYQVSTVLSDQWRAAIQPAAYVDTLAELGNLTLATVPVNLARSRDDITTPWALAFSMSTSIGCQAVLLRRDG